MTSAESKQIRATLVSDIENLGRPVALQRAEWEAAVQSVSLPADISVTHVAVADIPGEWLISSNQPANANVILFLHGGGYALGSCITHRDLLARLAQATGWRVLAINYRLAPENPFPAGLEDAVSAYGWLLAQGLAPHQIVLAGDSSGGGLSLATLLKLRDVGVPLPLAGVLISPWVDLALTGESLQSRANLDPLVSREVLREMAGYYLGNHDPTHPLASPLYAELHGLPPLLIQVGDHELLLSDATRLAERAKQAGVTVQLEIWEEMWHVWHGWAQDLPEARAALEHIAQFLSQQVAATLR